MNWESRIREAAYTSPSGVRIAFSFEDVSFSFEKKGTAFDSPDAEGSYIQGMGFAGKNYPFSAIFWGENYDLQADAFEAALKERGIGKLEHPKYGVVDVVPLGVVSRKDRLKSGANQTIVEVVFWETIGEIYPRSQADNAESLFAGVDLFNEATAEQFDSRLAGTSIAKKASLKNYTRAALAGVQGAIRDVSAAQTKVQRNFDDIYSSITLGVDILIGQPLTLAFQMGLLINAPARAGGRIEAQVQAYRGLLDVITQAPAAGAGEFAVDDLIATACVVGAATASVTSAATTRSDVVSAASDLVGQFETVTAWRDERLAALGLADSGEAAIEMGQALTFALNFLIDASFVLKQERRIILDRPRTMIDLTAEFYGEIDAKLDEFIDANKLIGTELLEIPAGREIVYYV